MDIEMFLGDIVLFINQVREKAALSAIRETVIKIAEEYNEMKRSGIDYMSYFHQEFSEDAELFILLLSVLFFLFKEEEVLEKAEEVVQWDTLPYDAAVGVLQQIRISRFSNKDLQIMYEAQRQLKSHMAARLKEELGGVSRIPYHDRNHNRIIISTDTLLSDRHAPTAIVLRLAKKLQVECGYDVRILVNIEKVDRNVIENCWLCPGYFNYIPQYDGEFERNWEGSTIRGYQHIVDTMHFSQVRQTIEYITEWKPECIWHVGGSSIFAEVLGEITTLAAMPCTSEVVVSDAPVLVSYFQNVLTNEIKEYITERGQHWIEIQIGSNTSSLKLNYSKKDFGISEYTFAIAIVGNRLDTEIGTNFVNVMHEIVELEPQVCFVLIGDTKRNWEKGNLAGHVKCLGYREDLVDVLEVMDLFLNPPRQGGGGGAVSALVAAIPVVTLADCDVAETAGEKFTCKNMEEIPSLVSKYCHDVVYYDKQVEGCRSLREKYLVLYDNESEEYKRVIVQISKWLQTGEIQ